MDYVYILLVLVLFASSLGLIRLCERVQWKAVTTLYVIAGIVALALLAYLVVALLKPETFS